MYIECNIWKCDLLQKKKEWYIKTAGEKQNQTDQYYVVSKLKIDIYIFT